MRAPRDEDGACRRRRAGPAFADEDELGARRRICLHSLIERVPHTHRYRVTDTGLHTAMFLIRVHDRLLPTGLSHLSDTTDTGPLHRAAIAYQHAFDTLTDRSCLIA